MQLYLSVTTSAVDTVQMLVHCLASVLKWTGVIRVNLDKTEILLRVEVGSERQE